MGTAAALGLAALFFLAGFSSAYYQHFPYKQIVALRQALSFHGLSPAPEPALPYQSQDEIRALIQLHTAGDVDAMRRRVIQFIWKRDALPLDAMPSEVREDVSDKRYGGLRDLARLDRLVVSMPHGFTSTVHLLRPARPNGTAVLYHYGHKDDLMQHPDHMAVLLRKGYTVAEICMPLDGPNRLEQPVDVPRYGRIEMTWHNEFAVLEDEEFLPLTLFIHPVLATANYIAAEGTCSSMNMIGFSGGGWTTTLYAALDERIQCSYPVAGTLPHFLHKLIPKIINLGDYEQIHPGLYRRANYMEMYVLGAAGKRRRQMQVLNRYDSCCYGGMLAQSYVPVVQDVLREVGMGGDFSLLLDETHRKHKISGFAMEKILEDMER